MNEFVRFEGMIGPQNLLSLVRNTAPFLFDGTCYSAVSADRSSSLMELGCSSEGFVKILRAAHEFNPSAPANIEDHQNYFALCMAAHHATVATFVPTDVDTKIRGLLWQTLCPPEALRKRFDFVVHAMRWDLSVISKRSTQLSGVGPVSGHNGEILGVLAGALGAFLREGDMDYAEYAAETIEYELQREIYEFEFALSLGNCEIDMLKIAMSILHNLGDLDQGISFWKNKPVFQPYKQRFGKLGHENTRQFNGAFILPAAIYKNILAAEGHRHYPLREIKALRRSPDLLLPLGPLFEEWGAVIGTHPSLETEERAEVLCALLNGCKKIKNQVGYFRAVAGMAQACDSKFGRVVDLMPSSARAIAKDPEVRRHMAISPQSFASSMRKKVQVTLEQFRQSTARGRSYQAQALA